MSNNHVSPASILPALNHHGSFESTCGDLLSQSLFDQSDCDSFHHREASPVSYRTGSIFHCPRLFDPFLKIIKLLLKIMEKMMGRCGFS